MRGATRCAQRLKVLFSSLRTKLGKVRPPSSGDPVAQMILGVLSRDMPESRAHAALDHIRVMVVDYNELRVIPPIELTEMLGDVPDARLKCEDISRSLNSIFALNHVINLDHLAELSGKDMRAWLDQIDGLEAYTRARIRLLGLRQHAIPLDEAMWGYARAQEIVDKRCPLEEAQAFLERQIAEEDALELVALLKRQAWTEMSAAVRDREVERILSVPPDRTARNMLQLVGAEEDLEDEVELASLEESSIEPDPAPVKRARKASGSRKKTAAARKTKTGKTRAKSKSSARGQTRIKARKGTRKSAAKSRSKTPKSTRAARKSKPKPKSKSTPQPKPRAKKARSSKSKARA
ncbi:MAG: hypothetical protein ABIG44_07075 [Planctomycetota bacterium]